MTLPLNQIILGDCINVLKPLPENSIDIIVTDPPYGLNFMGRKWDKALPPKEAFEQIIRVMKPAALAFIMSSPRQDVLWRMLSMLEGVGFELQQSFMSWIYRSGYPKAYDVSKGIDKRNNRHLQYAAFSNYLKSKRLEQKLSKRKIDELLGTNTAYSWWEGRKAGVQLPTKKYYFKLKELLDLDGRFDELIERIEAERQIIGKREKLDSFKEGYGVGYTDYNTISINITLPRTDLAKKWDGWKSQTGLKPALECILMVNKPFSASTIVDNVLKWGTGAINVDDCRIPFQSQKDSDYVEEKHDSVEGITRLGGNVYQWKEYEGERTNGFTQKGRFPANILVSDKALDDGTITGSGTYKPSSGGKSQPLSPERGWNKSSMTRDGKVAPDDYGDIGGKSRYFDLDAWAEHHGFLDVPKAGQAERDFGLTGFKKQVVEFGDERPSGLSYERRDGRRTKPRSNIHPTVKPLKLMAYLIELGCPPDGVVLDPFMGSGTTCIAAKRLSRRYIGIEIEPEYFEIAKARIAAYPQPLEWFNEGD